MLVPGVVPPQVHDFTILHVELHEILVVNSLLQPVDAPSVWQHEPLVSPSFPEIKVSLTSL